MVIPGYLNRSRHGIFYFRWPFPKQLHPQRQSSTIKVSLNTRDLQFALSWSMDLRYEAKKVLHFGLRHRMTYEEIRKLIKQHFTQLLDSKLKNIAVQGRLSSDVVVSLENGAEFAQQMLDGSTDDLIGSADAARDMLAVARPDAKVDEVEFDTVRREYVRGYREYCKEVLAHDQTYETYELRKTDIPQNSASEIVVPKPILHSTSTVSLADVIKNYSEEAEVGAQWAERTKLEKRGHFDLICEVLGSTKDLSAITLSDAQALKKVLLKYPTNRHKNPKTRGRSLSELLELKGVETLNVQTINKYLQTYGTMFEWALRNGYVSYSPSVGQFPA